MECDICKKNKDCMWKYNAEATLTIEERHKVSCCHYKESKEKRLRRKIINKEW